jgi:hypothetical protein
VQDTAIAELEEKAATAKKLEENLKKVKQLLMLARKDLAEAKSQVLPWLLCTLATEASPRLYFFLHVRP